MAVRFVMDLKGLDEWLEKIARAGGNVDDACDKALVAGGSVILDGMLAKVPKDTGNLENHIKMTPPKREGNQHFIEIGVLNADAKTARYGLVQEYGSAHDQAQPYVRPALDQLRTAARAAERESLKADGIL